MNLGLAEKIGELREKESLILKELQNSKDQVELLEFQVLEMEEDEEKVTKNHVLLNKDHVFEGHALLNDDHVFSTFKPRVFITTENAIVGRRNNGRPFEK